MGKWFLAALIIGFASTPVWAQTCSTERVGGSLIKLQVHCDLTKGLTAEDVAFLAGNLEKPYRISANEVSEEAIDSAFYIAIALMIGSGVAQDVPTGAKLLADIAEQRAQFDAFDRPGQAFFTGLGFDLNVPLDTLRAVLLGAGPYATNQSFAALDRHFRRVEMSGQTAVLINLIRAINLNVDAATPADQRPGYRQLAALAPRAPEAARVLDSWTGSVSDTVLQADAANGNRDAIRRRAQGVIDGTLEVRSRNQALSILDDAISTKPPFDEAFELAALLASARLFEEAYLAERFGSGDPRLSHIERLIELGYTDYGFKLFEWSRGEIAAYIPDAANGGHVPSQLLLGQAAESRGQPDDLIEAKRWYEMAAVGGSAEGKAKVAALTQVIARLEREAREREALAEANRAIMGRIINDPDAVKTETWKLTTDTFARPICRQMASQPFFATIVAGQAGTIGIKGEVCEFFSILQGSARLMVRQVEPGNCDDTGCDVKVELGCVTRGAPLLAFCSNFFKSRPPWETARLLPDAQSPTGFSLVWR